MTAVVVADGNAKDPVMSGVREAAQKRCMGVCPCVTGTCSGAAGLEPGPGMIGRACVAGLAGLACARGRMLPVAFACLVTDRLFRLE